MDTGGWAEIQAVVRAVAPVRHLEKYRGKMNGSDWHCAIYDMVIIALGARDRPKDKRTKEGKARYQLAVEAPSNTKSHPWCNDDVWHPSMVRAIQGHSIKFIDVKRTGILLDAKTIKGIPGLCHGTRWSVINDIFASGSLKSRPWDVGGAYEGHQDPGGAGVMGQKGRICLHFRPSNSAILVARRE